MLKIETYESDISEHLIKFIQDNKISEDINLDKELEEGQTFLNDFIEIIKKYSPTKRFYKNYLDGNSCLQMESIACQQSGDCFIEYNRKNVREYMGTS